MSFRSLPPPPGAGGGTWDRWMGAVLGFAVWSMLALMGLVFALSLAAWLLVLTVVSLVGSVFTGRPAAVTLLWRRWRAMSRQRWPQRPGSATPRADAARVSPRPDVAAAAEPSARVQDVAWREVPGGTARPANPAARDF